MSAAARSLFSFTYKSQRGKFFAEIALVHFFPKDNDVSFLKIAQSEFGGQKRVDDVGVFQFIAQAQKSVGDDVAVVKGEFRQFVNREKRRSLQRVIRFQGDFGAQ